MAASASNTAEIRSMNKKKIIQYVIRHPEKTRKQISDATELSFATVSNLTSQMIESGILISESSEQSQGGRIPGLISVNPTACCSICIDLSDDSSAAVALVNLKGERISGKTVTNTSDWEYEVLIRSCRKAADELLMEAGLTVDALIGVGVSIPGIYDYSRDVLVNATHTRLEGRSLCSDIAEIFKPLSCYAGNESNMAVLALAQAEPDRTVQDIVFLYLDDGLGIGIFTGGTLLQGVHGFGGEINHLRLGGSRGYPCYCGRKGCIETELSKSGFLKKYAELKPGKTVGWADFVSCVKAGEDDAMAVVRENGRLIGVLINDLQMLFDPESCWIGGGVAEIYEELLPYIRSYIDYEDICFPRIILNPVKDQAKTILTGCQTMVFDNWNP